MNKKIPTPLAILIILLVITIIIGISLWLCPKKETVTPDITYCEKDANCRSSCGCGCININEHCPGDKLKECDSYPCKCVNNKCVEDETADGELHVGEEKEFLDTDEQITADWKTYTNQTYNCQMKLPKDWGEINPMDGSFIPDISPNNDYVTFLSAKDGSEQIVVNHYSYSRAREHSLERSIDWYISFHDIDKKEHQRNLIRTRYEDIREIYIPQVNERKTGANKYTYLIEKEENDCLLEVGFLNKNSITKQILANLRFLD